MQNVHNTRSTIIAAVMAYNLWLWINTVNSYYNNRRTKCTLFLPLDGGPIQIADKFSASESFRFPVFSSEVSQRYNISMNYCTSLETLLRVDDARGTVPLTKGRSVDIGSSFRCYRLVNGTEHGHFIGRNTQMYISIVVWGRVQPKLSVIR